MEIEVNGSQSEQETGRHFVPAASGGIFEDADGNVSHDEYWDYYWDNENRLKGYETYYTIAGHTRERVIFEYDYLGRRYEKKYYTEVASSFVLQETERYIYDGWDLIARLVDGTLTQSYTWGTDVSGVIGGAGGVGGLLMVHEYSSGSINKTHFPIYDGNGNVMGFIDADYSSFDEDDSITAFYEYDAFGQTLRAHGSFAEANPIRFSSKYFDEETWHYYYGYRYYNPFHGRWLSRDPIGEEGGLNLYGFVGNDPVNNWDYLGLDFIALADRNVGGTGGIFKHLALEKWVGCNQKKDEELAVSAWKSASASDKVELLNTPNATAEVFKTRRKFGGFNKGAPKRETGWKREAIPMSVINYGGLKTGAKKSTRIMNIFDDTDGDVDQKWDAILRLAASYKFAEQGVRD